MLAERIAAELGKAGYVVVSGLARGVDAAAHRGGLATGTIAVLAGGLDQPYPPQNLKLHDDIADRGPSSAKRRSASSRARGISRAAITWSPVFRAASSLSKRRCGRVR